eukprot:g33194.t1
MQSLSSNQKKAVLLVAAAAGFATACGYYRYRQAQGQQPCAAKEARTPIPRHGVSVALLLATYQRWEAAGRLAAGATTDDVVRKLVKPATANQKCSYAELLARLQDPKDRAGVATATVFISHAWKYSFKNVVEAIAAHWPDKGDLRSRTFLWLDIFTINQHETAKVDQNFWFDAFRKNVRDISHTVLILSPWRNPLPLTRSWCLWEIFCTRDTGGRFEICLSQDEAKDFEDALVNDFPSIMASLCQIDVKKAQAFKKEDQKKILTLVEGQGGGAHETNKAVLAQMRAWLARPGRNAHKARKGKTDADTLTLMNQVGLLLREQGDLKRGGTSTALLRRTREDLGGRAPAHVDFCQQPGLLAAAAGQAGGGRGSVPQGPSSTREDSGGRAPAHDDFCQQPGLVAVSAGQAGGGPLSRRALQTREKTLGAEHPNTLTSVSNLALLLSDQGKLVQAESLYRRALQAREKTLGAEHPDTLISVGSLGSLLHKQGKLAEAEPLCRRALQAREKTLGAEHPDTLISVNNLASLMKEQGKLEEAEPLYRRDLQESEKTLGAEHPHTLTSVGNLALLLKQQGKLAEAEPLCRRALQAREKTFGAEHPDTLVSVRNQARYKSKRRNSVPAWKCG